MRWVGGLAALALVVPVGVSLGGALTAPGTTGWPTRTVDWVRDHGGSGLVDRAENVFYTLQAPADTDPPATAVPAPVGAPVPGPGGPGIRLPVTAGRRLLPDEGRWHAGRPDAHGRPTAYTAWFRPDAAHASVVAGVAWLRRGATALHLVTGTLQPEPGTPGTHTVPAGAIPRLVAVFNSGWRMTDVRGGFLLDGHVDRPLVSGEASAVIDARGRLTVGAWGRDVRLGRSTVAVRQNLRLIVDHGRLAGGLDANVGGAWGSPKNQYQFTERSALGQDARGDLVYVAGNGLTLHTLAQTLVDAGAVRGMELDIHRGLPMFTLWTPGGPRGATPHRLLPSMISPLNRYLLPEQRDFFYAELR